MRKKPTPKKKSRAQKQRLDELEQLSTQDWADDHVRRNRKLSPEAAKLLEKK